MARPGGNLRPRLCENYLLLNFVVDVRHLLAKIDFKVGNQR